MDLKKIFDLAKKLEIKFVNYEEAVKENKTSIVIRDYLPRGIYIPFSDIPRLISIISELKNDDNITIQLRKIIDKEEGQQ